MGEIKPLPQLSEDARLLAERLKAEPHDETLWLVYADACDECGCHSDAQFARMRAGMNRHLRELCESLAVPAKAFAASAGEAFRALAPAMKDAAKALTAPAAKSSARTRTGA